MYSHVTWVWSVLQGVSVTELISSYRSLEEIAIKKERYVIFPRGSGCKYFFVLRITLNKCGPKLMEVSASRED